LASPPYVGRTVWRQNLNTQLVSKDLAEALQAQEVTGLLHPVADDRGVSRDGRLTRWGQLHGEGRSSERSGPSIISVNRNIRRVLNSAVLPELDLSRPFVYLPEQQARCWKDGWERYVRQACDQLDIHRRGVHGFRATAACEFVNIKGALGYTDMEARHELATPAPHAPALRCSADVWLGHNPHRTEVTYAYVPKGAA
jgi:hypothetical protein